MRSAVLGALAGLAAALGLLAATSVCNVSIQFPDLSGPFVSRPAPSGTVKPSFTPTPRAVPNATPRPGTAGQAGPVGYPVDPNLKPMRVVEINGRKRVVDPLPDGPDIATVAREVFARPANDDLANRYGWNCRTHQRYEDGFPAVDWYLPQGTPVYAVMDGEAELAIITVSNSFEYYRVDNGLYLGLPAANVPIYSFPGPSGGMGVYVSVFDGVLKAEAGHLELDATVRNVPASAWLSPYSPRTDFARQFARPRGPRDGTVVARWQVRRGDLIGFVGNTGYSDVPHLHYQIITPDRNTKYCPSSEAFPFAGWLFGRPAAFPGY